MTVAGDRWTYARQFDTVGGHSLHDRAANSGVCDSYPVGTRAMLAREIMTLLIVSVWEETSLEEVAGLMLDRNLGCVLVRDARNHARGIITESDFTARERYLPFSTERSLQLLGEPVGWSRILEVYERARGRSAREVMSSPVISISEDAYVTDAARIMHSRDIGYLPVMRDAAVVGILSRHDLVKLVRQHPPGPTQVEVDPLVR